VTILILEDEPVNAGLIRHFLDSYGYTTLVAKNVAEALQLADDASQTIDLLLADIMLSGCHGIEIARQIAVTRPEVKTLFMSGYPLESLLEELPGYQLQLKSAQMFFLQKPFTGPTLRLKIAEVLGCGLAVAAVESSK
jgi:two-component system cell cycle sensor histidine kinase/response regulator CckA